MIFDAPLVSIREACERLFAFRNRHSWPPTVTARAGWEERYAQEAQGLDVLPNLDAAIEWTNALIDQITQATDAPGR